MRRNSFLLLGIGLVVAACGDDSVPGGSGGDGGAGGVGGIGTEGGSGGSGKLSKPSAGLVDCAQEFLEEGVCRPSLAKCSPGSVVDIEQGCLPVGVTDCDPGFVDARGICLPHAADCEPGSFPVPTQGCVAIDGELGCGVGTWGNVEDAAENLYVDGAYAGGDSDGTQAKPFTQLAAALAEANADSRVVLAAGEYEAGVTLPPGVELRGVCASQVTLLAAADSGAILLLDQAGAAVTVSDLTLTGDAMGARVNSGELTLRRVRFQGVASTALDVRGEGSVALLEESLVSDTVEGSGNAAIGVYASSGAAVTVSRSAVLRSRSTSLAAASGASLLAEDVLVEGTTVDSSGIGYSASAVGGAALTLRKAVLVDNAWGIYGGDSVTIEDSTLGRCVDEGSDHVSQVNGPLTIERTAIVDGNNWGVASFPGQQGLIRLEHVLIADLGIGAYGGAGVSLAEGGVLRSSTFTRLSGNPITLLTTSTVDGIVVEDISFDIAFGAGTGMVGLAEGGNISVEDSYFRNIPQVAIWFDGTSETAFSVKRTQIEEMSGIQGEVGLGIVLRAPSSSVEIEDTWIDRSRAAGLMSVDTNVVLRRSLITAVLTGTSHEFTPDAPQVGPLGDGVLFTQEFGGGGVTMDSVWIEGAERAGFVASGGTHALTTTRVGGSPVGIALRDGATLTQTALELGDNEVEIEEPTTLVVP